MDNSTHRVRRKRAKYYFQGVVETKVQKTWRGDWKYLMRSRKIRQIKTILERGRRSQECGILRSRRGQKRIWSWWYGVLYRWESFSSRARSEPGGTRWRTGGEVKGKLANGVGSQYSHATSERGLSSITQADAHTSATSSRLNWRPHRFKWTRPFRGKTKYGFCACTITFRTNYTCSVFHLLKKKVHWGCLRTGGDNSISTKREK